MQFTALTAAAILALTSSTDAISSQIVFNYCEEPIFVTSINSTKDTTGPLEVPGLGGNWTSEIIGVGNSLGVTKSDKFWTNETAKLILGTSTDLGVLYWTVSNVDGDPFAEEPFELVSGEANACENATT